MTFLLSLSSIFLLSFLFLSWFSYLSHHHYFYFRSYSYQDFLIFLIIISLTFILILIMIFLSFFSSLFLLPFSFYHDFLIFVSIIILTFILILIIFLSYYSYHLSTFLFLWLFSYHYPICLMAFPSKSLHHKTHKKQLFKRTIVYFLSSSFTFSTRGAQWTGDPFPPPPNHNLHLDSLRRPNHPLDHFPRASCKHDTLSEPRGS